MKERAQVIRVNCNRCGKEMLKYQRSREDEEKFPFPFDSICGFCITPAEVSRHYPKSRGAYLKHNKRKRI